MKKLSFIIIALLMLSMTDVCGQSRNKAAKVKADTLVVAEDSLEYELIVIDPGFEVWLINKPSIWYHTNDYYRSRNNLYVSEWNHRYMNPLYYGDIYESYIDYSQDIDYGVELNYKLYYYFKYFEETNHVKLLPF